MKSTSTLTVLLLLAFASQATAFGQKLYVLVHGGRSSYGSLYVAPLGGGGGDRSWDAGPLFGAGARLKTSESFSFAGTVEYSRHPYHSSGVAGKPANSIFDFFDGVAAPLTKRCSHLNPLPITNQVSLPPC